MVSNVAMLSVAHEQLMTIRQAASLLGVNQSTVRRHIERGLEAVRIGGKVYTSREAIERFSRPMTAEVTKATKRDRAVLAFARRNLGLRI